MTKPPDVIAAVFQCASHFAERSRDRLGAAFAKGRSLKERFSASTIGLLLLCGALYVAVISWGLALIEVTWFGIQGVKTTSQLMRSASFCIAMLPVWASLIMGLSKDVQTSWLAGIRRSSSIVLVTCFFLWLLPTALLVSQVWSIARLEWGFLGEKATRRAFAEAASLTTSSQDPSIKGKAAILNKSGGVSWLTLDLPDAIRATSLHNTGTVVVIRRDKFQSGTYSNGSPAFTRYIELAIVDPDGPTKIVEHTVFGEDPPRTIKTTRSSGGGGGGTTGARASEREVIQYLTSLKREK